MRHSRACVHACACVCVRVCVWSLPFRIADFWGLAEFFSKALKFSLIPLIPAPTPSPQRNWSPKGLQHQDDLHSGHSGFCFELQFYSFPWFTPFLPPSLIHHRPQTHTPATGCQGVCAPVLVCFCLSVCEHRCGSLLSSGTWCKLSPPSLSPLLLVYLSAPLGAQTLPC